MRYNINKPDRKTIDKCIKHFQKEKYFVIIDDAHLLLNNQEGQYFISELSNKFEWVVLLSSQSIDEKNTLLKNASQKFNLTQLPHLEAVEQIKNSFMMKNNRLAQVSKPKQADYFAYRMWFFLGGNLRAFKDKILIRNFAKYTQYFLEAQQLASDQTLPVQMAEASNKILPAKKKVLFRDLFELLTHQYSLQKEDIVNLNFQILVGDNKLQRKFEKVDFLQQNNILVRKYQNLKDESGEFEGSIESINFHSRRTQLAFSYWILDEYEQYWTNSKERVAFQQLLQRIDYQYTLQYQILKLKRDVRNQHKQREKKGSAIIEGEKEIQRKTPNSLSNEKIKTGNYLESQEQSTKEAFLKLAQTRISLTIKLYQIYQRKRDEVYSETLATSQKQIMRDLVKGPDHFQAKYKKLIEQEFEANKNLKQSILNTYESIELLKGLPGVSQYEKQYYAKQSQDYLVEFKEMGGFNLQNDIKQQDFQTLEFIDEQKFKSALHALALSCKPYQRQAASTALELAIDSHYRKVKAAKPLKQNEIQE